MMVEESTPLHNSSSSCRYLDNDWWRRPFANRCMPVSGSAWSPLRRSADSVAPRSDRQTRAGGTIRAEAGPLLVGSFIRF
jgi:hypothetical protein